jgi:hypothetical protein
MYLPLNIFLCRLISAIFSYLTEANSNCCCSQKRQHASVSNYRPVYLLNNISKLFEFVIHDHVSHNLKFKISPYKHGFSESKSATTNLVTYVDFISPLVGSQRQADTVHFDLSDMFDVVPHSLLLHKLSTLALPGT